LKEGLYACIDQGRIAIFGATKKRREQKWRKEKVYVVAATLTLDMF